MDSAPLRRKFQPPRCGCAASPGGCGHRGRGLRVRPAAFAVHCSRITLCFSGRTALHHSAFHGHAAVVALPLSKDAPVSGVDRYKTLMMLAQFRVLELFSCRVLHGRLRYLHQTSAFFGNVFDHDPALQNRIYSLHAGAAAAVPRRHEVAAALIRIGGCTVTAALARRCTGRAAQRTF